MTQNDELIQEKLNNLKEKVDNVPTLMKQIETSFTRTVDTILTLKLEAFDKTLEDIRGFIRNANQQIGELKDKDHSFELQFTKMVKSEDFEGYKKEMREEIKIEKARIDKLEDDKTFLSGGFGTLVKVGSFVVFVLTIVTMALSITSSLRTSEKAEHNSKRLDKLEGNEQ